MLNKTLRHYMASMITDEINAEIDRSEEIHGPFHSLHEGLAVLREEYLELEKEVFWGLNENDDPERVRAEAIQVAAVAMRLAMMISPIPVIPQNDEGEDC